MRSRRPTKYQYFDPDDDGSAFADVDRQVAHTQCTSQYCGVCGSNLGCCKMVNTPARLAHSSAEPLGRGRRGGCVFPAILGELAKQKEKREVSKK